MMWTVLALLGMGVLAAFGSFFLKLTASKGLSPRTLLLTPQLYVGGLLYVGSSVLNFWLLKKLPYSVVVPAGALCYAWTLLISRCFLKEKVNGQKLLGVAVIIIGVVMTAV